MSKEYDKYLYEHTNNVAICYKLFWNEDLPYKHDASKYSEEEYTAYANYHHPEGDEPTEEQKLAYDYAVLHHIHNNPHHWQYWALLDEKDEDRKLLPIPDKYIKEMIADWASFALKEKDPKKLIKWYKENRDTIHVNKESKKKLDKSVVYAYKKLKEYFDES